MASSSRSRLKTKPSQSQATTSTPTNPLIEGLKGVYRAMGFPEAMIDLMPKDEKGINSLLKGLKQRDPVQAHAVELMIDRIKGKPLSAEDDNVATQESKKIQARSQVPSQWAIKTDEEIRQAQAKEQKREKEQKQAHADYTFATKCFNEAYDLKKAKERDEKKIDSLYDQAVVHYRKAFQGGIKCELPLARALVERSAPSIREEKEALSFAKMAEKRKEKFAAYLYVNLLDRLTNNGSVPPPNTPIDDILSSVIREYKALPPTHPSKALQAELLDSVYRKGILTKQDDTQAQEWRLEAARMGSKNAALRLILHYSQPSTFDVEKALYWAQHTANQGFVPSMFYLATLAKDDSEKVRWLRNIIDHDPNNQENADITHEFVVRATTTLGVHYLEAKGVEKDLGQARHHFEMAAREGCQIAASYLGQMLLLRRENRSEADKREGRKWLVTAANHGNNAAALTLYLDSLEETFGTPSSLQYTDDNFIKNIFEWTLADENKESTAWLEKAPKIPLANAILGITYALSKHPHHTKKALQYFGRAIAQGEISLLPVFCQKLLNNIEQSHALENQLWLTHIMTLCKEEIPQSKADVSKTEFYLAKLISVLTRKNHLNMMLRSNNIQLFSLAKITNEIEQVFVDAVDYANGVKNWSDLDATIAQWHEQLSVLESQKPQLTHVSIATPSTLSTALSSPATTDSPHATPKEEKVKTSETMEVKTATDETKLTATSSASSSPLITHASHAAPMKEAKVKISGAVEVKTPTSSSPLTTHASHAAPMKEAKAKISGAVEVRTPTHETKHVATSSSSSSSSSLLSASALTPSYSPATLPGAETKFARLEMETKTRAATHIVATTPYLLALHEELLRLEEVIDEIAADNTAINCNVLERQRDALLSVLGRLLRRIAAEEEGQAAYPDVFDCSNAKIMSHYILHHTPLASRITDLTSDAIGENNRLLEAAKVIFTELQTKLEAVDRGIPPTKNNLATLAEKTPFLKTALTSPRDSSCPHLRMQYSRNCLYTLKRGKRAKNILLDEQLLRACAIFEESSTQLYHEQNATYHSEQIKQAHYGLKQLAINIRHPQRELTRDDFLRMFTASMKETRDYSFMRHMPAANNDFFSSMAQRDGTPAHLPTAPSAPKRATTGTLGLYGNTIPTTTTKTTPSHTR